MRGFGPADAHGQRGNGVVRRKPLGAKGSGEGLAICAVFLIASSGFALLGSSGTPAQTREQTASFATPSPLHFEPSRNLPGSRVKYSARAASYSLFLASDETDVVLHGEDTPRGELARGKLIVVEAYAKLLRMRFVDSDLPTRIGPLGPGNRPHSYSTSVAYRGIYPGTDVVMSGDQHGIGFQLRLWPGADAGHIVLELGGSTGITLDQEGNAVVRVGRASLTLQKPSLRICCNRTPRPPTVAYRIETENRLRFVLALPEMDLRDRKD